VGTSGRLALIKALVGSVGSRCQNSHFPRLTM
jgi:hypothetical protein